MDGIRVRAEHPGDFQAIDVVNLSAFECEREAKLVSELRQRPTYSPDLSLVAEFNGRLVGHLMLTPSSVLCNEEEVSVLLLAPMSVVPSQSHRGIGTVLVEEAITRGRDANYSAVVVVGKPDYYALHGFKPSNNWGLRCNLPVPDDAVMAIELVEGALGSEGMVKYATPFLAMY